MDDRAIEVDEARDAVAAGKKHKGIIGFLRIVNRRSRGKDTGLGQSGPRRSGHANGRKETDELTFFKKIFDTRHHAGSSSHSALSGMRRREPTARNHFGLGQ
jgi:hypothetical protein